MNLTAHSYSTLAGRAKAGLGATLFVSVTLLPACSQASTDPQVSVDAPTVSAISRSTLVGNTSASQKIYLVVGLKMADSDGMDALIKDISNPSSPNYRHFLTPSQIGARFGQSTANLAPVTTYLGKYFTSASLTPDRTAILVSGTVGQANSAFGVTEKNYRARASDIAVGSLTFRAAPTAPKLPQSIASKISVLVGLENFYRRKPMSTLTPSMLRNLYKGNSIYNDPSGSPAGDGLKGEGVTVGITNLDGFRLSNLSRFYSVTGLPAPAGGIGSNVRVVAVNGGTGQTDPVQGEGDLDIQMVLASAPKTNLVVYDAPNDGAGGLAILQQQLKDAAFATGPDIVSESYGSPLFNGTFDVRAQEYTVHKAMALAGVTYLVSSGDHGTYKAVVEDPQTIDQVNYSGSMIDPYIVAVGGTSATTDASGNRLSEVGWVGSGGGWTAYRSNGLSFNVRPDYQQNIGIANDPTHNYRLYPDVALHASGTNLNFSDYGTTGADAAVYVVDSGADSGASGTSASSPIFAGELALMLQKLKANDAITPNEFNNTYRLGFINGSLYDAAADPTAGAFTDITTGGSNGLLPDGTTSQSASGYDFVTGLGAPNISNLYTYFFGLAGTTLFDAPSGTNVYVPTNGYQGTPPQATNADVDPTTSTVTSLETGDGFSYSVTSASQPGVGQATGVEMALPLAEGKTLRSLSLQVMMNSPQLTTGYIYAKNASGTYVLLSTVTGRGTSQTITMSMDPTVYASSGSVSLLVRALKPQRLGSAMFTLSVDRAVLIEKVAKS